MEFILFAIITAMVFVQFARTKEREADLFALERMNSLEGMVKATEKLRNAHMVGKFMNDKGIIIQYFKWNPPPSERIAMAKNFHKMRE